MIVFRDLLPKSEKEKEKIEERKILQEQVSEE